MQQTLRANSALGVNTIRRAELADRETSLTSANDRAIRRALEAAGVVFIGENGGGWVSALVSGRARSPGLSQDGSLGIGREFIGPTRAINPPTLNGTRALARPEFFAALLRSHGLLGRYPIHYQPAISSHLQCRIPALLYRPDPAALIRSLPAHLLQSATNSGAENVNAEGVQPSSSCVDCRFVVPGGGRRGIGSVIMAV